MVSSRRFSAPPCDLPFAKFTQHAGIKACIGQFQPPFAYFQSMRPRTASAACRKGALFHELHDDDQR
jgi:hypothetical protein